MRHWSVVLKIACLNTDRLAHHHRVLIEVRPEQRNSIPGLQVASLGFAGGYMVHQRRLLLKMEQLL
jgi:hypothetical protein